MTQLAIKWLFSFPPHPTFAFAVPGENWKSKILHFYSMQCHFLIKIVHIWRIFPQISSTLVETLSNCLVVQLLTVNIWNISHLCKHRQGEAFSIRWYQCWMFCFRLSQLLFEFIDIFKQSPINLLLHNTANTVCDQSCYISVMIKFTDVFLSFLFHVGLVLLPSVSPHLHLLCVFIHLFCVSSCWSVPFGHSTRSAASVWQFRGPAYPADCGQHD